LNNPPVYNSSSVSYAALTIPLNSVQTIPVPAFHDPDGSDSFVYLSEISKVTATANVIAYASALPGPLIVAPVAFAEVGVHNIEVILSDYSPGTTWLTKTPWTITVTNSAPYFNVPVLPNATVQMNFVTLYVVNQF
jgi:hypothetical protein